MIVFPCAKINLGLNIVGKRADGYHNIETVFYPVPLFDALEIKYMSDDFPSQKPCDLKVTGNAIDCNENENLVIKAYRLLAEDFDLPRVHAHLFKRIPMKAGLGGGSSDGAFMIKLIDERFRLNIGIAEMERYASQLGADCAFFITAMPSFAQGIGNELEPSDNPKGNLNGYYVAIVKPDVEISTAEAYGSVIAHKPDKTCREIVRQPIETWKDELVNDFESSVFPKHPVLKEIKEKLYAAGALYASMSGSGSAIYGLFREKPCIDNEFQGMFSCILKLK